MVSRLHDVQAPRKELKLGSKDGASTAGGRHPWRSVSAIAAALIAVGLGVFFASADAQDGREPAPEDHVTVLHDEGRFTGPGVWPPAPQSADTPLISQAAPAISNRSASAVEVTGAPLAETAERMELRPEVIAELGDRYSLITAAHPPAPTATDKLAVDSHRIELVWFSRTNNQSVLATVIDGGLTELSTLPAAEGQPAFSDEEHARAIQLATEHWRAEIGARVDDLVAFSIPELREDGTVHDVRMAYVTMHADARAVPELLTWVDLTNEEIVNARVDR